MATGSPGSIASTSRLETDGIVIACSALKATYRTHHSDAAGAITHASSISTLPRMRSIQLATRTGHFMAGQASSTTSSPPSMRPGHDADDAWIDANERLDDVVNTVLTSVR